MHYGSAEPQDLTDKNGNIWVGKLKNHKLKFDKDTQFKVFSGSQDKYLIISAKIASFIFRIT